MWSTTGEQRALAIRFASLPTVWAHLALCGLIALFFAFKEVKMKKVGIIMGSDSDLPIIQ